MARDKRHSLFDFSHLRKRTHSIWVTHYWNSILNLHDLIHSRHRFLCLSHGSNELLVPLARGQLHALYSFVSGDPLKSCHAFIEQLNEIMEHERLRARGGGWFIPEMDDLRRLWKGGRRN